MTQNKPSGISAPNWRRIKGFFAKQRDRFPGRTAGSKNRNLFSFYILSLCVLIALDTWAGHFDLRLLPGTITSVALVTLSFVYFYQTTIGVVILVSQQFEIAPIRLLRDISISVAYVILSFALLYQEFGIRAPTGETASPLDHVYFSAVTFSTLGYGDFSPSPAARPIAALQALFGNVHLGMIVGAFYLMIEHFRARPSK